MAQEAELRVSSQNVEQLTTALDNLINILLKLQGATDGAEKSVGKLDSMIKKVGNVSSTSAKGVDRVVNSIEKVTPSADKSKKSIDKVTKSIKHTGKESKKQGKEVSGLQKKFKEMGESAQLVTGPLGGIASRIAVMGRVAKSGGIAVVAIATALTLLTKGALAAGEAADRANLRMSQLEAQLTATGHAAGFTAKELDTFARNLAFATLDSHEGVIRLVSAMQTFRNVTGDTFKTAITLSQDLGLAMSQDPVSAAKQLGKVLQNPLANYKQLKRAGIEFNDTQVQALKDARRNNDLLAEQKIITDEVSKSVAGLAKAQADSLAGDRDTFSQKFDLLAETIGKRTLPAMREVVKVANSITDSLIRMTQTEAEGYFADFQNEVDLSAKSTEELTKLISQQTVTLDDQKAALERSVKAAEDANANLTLSFGERTKAVLKEGKAQKDLRSSIEISIETLKRLNDTLAVREDFNTPEAPEPEGLQDYLKSLQVEIDSQTRLNGIFKETGDARSKSYRDAKIATDVAKEALEKYVGISDEDLQKIEQRKRALSDLTEARVRANTVIQIQKGLENKNQGLQLEVRLQRLLASGLVANSREYINQKLAIEGKNKAISAGFEEGTKEFNQIVKSTVALSSYSKQLADIQVLKASGISLVDGFKVINNDIVKARIDLSQKLKSLDAIEFKDEEIKLQAIQNLREEFADRVGGSIGINLDINTSGLVEAVSSVEKARTDLSDRIEELDAIEFANEEEKLQAIAELRKQYAEKQTAELGFTVSVDENGIESILDELEANEALKNEKLKELREFAQTNDLLDHTSYLEEKEKITREYADREAKIKKDSYEASAGHRTLVNAMEIAGYASNALQTLSIVKGKNKELARMSKAAAIFQASVSLVDQLSAAASVEPYWAKFAAYAEAATTGANIIQMAQNLNTPNFAFGGVNINGPGTGRSDSIQANIASGESVITAPATARNQDLLRRINSGLAPAAAGLRNGGGGVVYSPSITVQGDASEQTLVAIEDRLMQFEEKVHQIARDESLVVITEEQDPGGLFDPI